MFAGTVTTGGRAATTWCAATYGQSARRLMRSAISRARALDRAIAYRYKAPSTSTARPTSRARTCESMASVGTSTTTIPAAHSPSYPASIQIDQGPMSSTMGRQESGALPDSSLDTRHSSLCSVWACRGHHGCQGKRGHCMSDPDSSSSAFTWQVRALDILLPASRPPASCQASSCPPAPKTMRRLTQRAFCSLLPICAHSHADHRSATQLLFLCPRSTCVSRYTIRRCSHLPSTLGTIPRPSIASRSGQKASLTRGVWLNRRWETLLERADPTIRLPQRWRGRIPSGDRAHSCH